MQNLNALYTRLDEDLKTIGETQVDKQKKYMIAVINSVRQKTSSNLKDKYNNYVDNYNRCVQDAASLQSNIDKYKTLINAYSPNESTQEQQPLPKLIYVEPPKPAAKAQVPPTHNLSKEEADLLTEFQKFKL